MRSELRGSVQSRPRVSVRFPLARGRCNGGFAGRCYLSFAHVAPGASADELRRHLRATAKSTWQYVNWLTHAKQGSHRPASAPLHRRRRTCTDTRQPRHTDSEGPRTDTRSPHRTDTRSPVAPTSESEFAPTSVRAVAPTAKDLAPTRVSRNCTDTRKQGSHRPAPAPSHRQRRTSHRHAKSRSHRHAKSSLHRQARARSHRPASGPSHRRRRTSHRHASVPSHRHA